MSVSGDIEISELSHPEDEQDPRATRTEDHISRIQERFESSGWLSPIIFTADDKLIIDGNTRVKALEDLDENIQLQVLGEFQGYVYAIPDTDLEIDPEEASAELNIFRENLTEPERAQFLLYLVKSRIINNDEIRVAGDAIPVSELLSNLENDERDNRSYEWEHDEKAKSELKEFLSALDFDSPSRARAILGNYNKAPSHVRELWLLDELYSGHIEELNNIRGLLDSGADLNQSSTARSNQFKDLVEYSRKKYQQEDEYYRRDDLRDIVDDLNPNKEPGTNEKPTDVDKDEFKQFKQEEITAEERKKANRVADYEDELSTEEVLKKCYNSHKKGENFSQDLNEAVKEIEELEQEINERKKKRRRALDEFDFVTDSKFADGEADHLAPPVETQNFGVFFHDVQEMDDEVDNEELQLIFTSPPYFTQSDRIVERWWPEDIEYTDDNITEQTIDKAYQNYLDEMKEIFQLLHSKLEQGRYLILNISDTKSYGLKKKSYDIPSDLSYLIRHEVNKNYESQNQFNYDATIAWDKGEGQTHDRNQSFFADGKPLTYHPNWRYERLLVFRKGKRIHPENDFRLKTTDFQPYSDDVWSIENKTQASDHEAGFTAELPKKIIQLYSYPGDTVADPFGGYSITLYAAKILNEQVHPDEPDWTGYGWENFASETVEQGDYKKRIEQLLTSNLAQFRREYMLED
jgi:site-specific DNA-methyltransferase (adenine-specific)